MEPITQTILIPEFDVTLSIRRDDLIHPTIPGNKLRKLKYNLLQAKADKNDTLLTFGGAFSNHVAAVAAAGKEFGFKTIGIIRGEELAGSELNPTLQFAKQEGMQLHFISRERYSNKSDPDFLKQLQNQFGLFYLLPEGGTNALAIRGCEEVLQPSDVDFDYICCAVGTGGTIAGIINRSAASQKILGFPALKGDFLFDEIGKYAVKSNWTLTGDYHFGGYGKVDETLIAFINEFNQQHSILFDPIYTGKMIFGVMDLMKQRYFAPGSKILAIHTGGLQGIQGMNNKLKNKNLPLIETK